MLVLGWPEWKMGDHTVISFESIGAYDGKVVLYCSSTAQHYIEVCSIISL